eukprot:6381691-Prymnesium_polylepis.2
MNMPVIKPRPFFVYLRARPGGSVLCALTACECQNQQAMLTTVNPAAVSSTVRTTAMVAPITRTDTYTIWTVRAGRHVGACGVWVRVSIE